MPIRIVCSCGAKLNAKEELVGKSVKCPKCGNPIKVTADGSGGDAKTAATAKSTTPKTPAKPKTETTAPEHAAMHDLFDEIGLAPAPPKADIQCPKCGAAMQEGAVLCVSCGYHVQSGKQLNRTADSDAEANRERIYAQQAAKAAARAPTAAPGSASFKPKQESVEFTAMDWVACTLCSGIGCICGIIYCVTGNPKGPKMLGISLAVSLVLTALNFGLGLMLGLAGAR